MLKKHDLFTTLCTVLGASFTLSCGALLAETPAAASPAKTEKASQDIDINKLSEAFGNFIGKNLKSSGLNFDISALITGIKNGAEGKPSPLSEQEYEKGMLTLQERAITKLAEDNLAVANKYLSENEKKEGVIVLIPGKLQYQIVTTGSGDAVKESGTPKIEFKGTFADGTVFGSSDDAGGAIALPLDQTFPGFAKAIAGMKEGETRRIFVHPDEGYGTMGQVPPNSLLIFDVKVIKADASGEVPTGEVEDELDLYDEEETPPLAELDIKVKQEATPTKNAEAKPTEKKASSDYSDEDDDMDDEDDEDDDLDDEDYDDDEDEDDDSQHSGSSNKTK